MAGGHVKYRTLSRDSAARMALLRGLVTSLVQHEHIMTTHAKAKEAQRMADKLITLAKKNNEPCRRHAQGILYQPHLHLPKLFGELRTRFQDREGGYTRVVRTEPRNTYDQAETSILEYVDGPKDTRFMMTAKTVARDRLMGRQATAVTQLNIKKVTQFRGEDPFEEMVQRFMALGTAEPDEPVPQAREFPAGRSTATEVAGGAEGAQVQAAVEPEVASARDVESERVAAAELERARQMANDIVPKSVKRHARR